MSRPITDDEMATLREIAADPKADELLRAKCRWERMTRAAVLREWGDPRTWDDYAEAAAPAEGKP